MGGKLVRRISAKTVMGAVKVPATEITLFTVLGRANKLKPYKSTFGDGLGLVGQFEAHKEDGSMVFGPQCYLPEPMHSMITAQLESGEVNEVEFACKIGLKPADNAFGYEYTCEPLVEMRESDALSHLRVVVKLEAPKTPKLEAVAQAEPEAVPAPKAKAGKE